VYLTAGFSIGEESSSGGGRLFIGRYRQVADEAGIPPAVAITSPADGSSAVEGSDLQVAATASDDVLVAAVDFLVDGATVATDTTTPYQTTIQVPNGASSVTLGARAVDFGDNAGHAADVVVQVIPDPGTTVVGLVTDPAGNPIAGATAEAFGNQATTGSDGTFSILGVPTVRGPIIVQVSKLFGADPITASSVEAEPIPGGTTDVGTIVLVPSACGRGTLFFDNAVTDLAPRPKRVVANFTGQCHVGPVDFPVDLFKFGPVPQLGQLAELAHLSPSAAGLDLEKLRRAAPQLGAGGGSGEELVRTVTPDADGHYCTDLQPGILYVFRRENVLCDNGSVAASCYGYVLRFDPNVVDHCGDAGATCEDLGTTTFFC